LESQEDEDWRCCIGTWREAPWPPRGFGKSVKAWSQAYKFRFLRPLSKVTNFRNYLLIPLLSWSNLVSTSVCKIPRSWMILPPASIYFGNSGNTLKTTILDILKKRRLLGFLTYQRSLAKEIQVHHIKIEMNSHSKQQMNFGRTLNLSSLQTTSRNRHLFKIITWIVKTG